MLRFRSNFVSSLKNDYSFNSSILNFKSALFKTKSVFVSFLSLQIIDFQNSFDSFTILNQPFLAALV